MPQVAGVAWALDTGKAPWLVPLCSLHVLLPPPQTHGPSLPGPPDCWAGRLAQHNQFNSVLRPKGFRPRESALCLSERLRTIPPRRSLPGQSCLLHSQSEASASNALGRRSGANVMLHYPRLGTRRRGGMGTVCPICVSPVPPRMASGNMFCWLAMPLVLLALASRVGPGHWASRRVGSGVEEGLSSHIPPVTLVAAAQGPSLPQPIPGTLVPFAEVVTSA